MTRYAQKQLGYLITYTTYGSWLHGSSSGSIDKDRNSGKTVFISSNRNLQKFEKTMLQNHPFAMNAEQRQIVLDAILEVCHFRKWNGYALHIRSNHVHAVVSGNAKPEKIMNDFKSYSTRALKEKAISPLPKRIWTRHGSTKYLWTDKELQNAINYVKDGQGRKMAFGQKISNPNTKHQTIHH